MSEATRKPARSEAAAVSELRLQRKCACGQHTAGGGECEECRTERQGVLQRSATGLTVGEVPSIVRESLDSSGQPLEPQLRTFMESRFGHDFSRVRVHSDAHAAKAAEAVQARAYTSGNDVVFGTGQYAPATAEGRMLMAHELSHVVQQRGELGAAEGPLRLSHPTDPAERAADHAAEAVMSASPAPELGSTPAAVVHRMVKTTGGEFDTTKYAAVNQGAGVGKNVGAEINLKFTPNDLVEADTIGLVQTVKTLRSTSKGGAVDDPSYVSSGNRAVSLTGAEGDLGRAVDQLDMVPGTTLPQTSPLYAVGNARKPDPNDPKKNVDTVAQTLTDVGPDPANGWGQHGKRKRKLDRSFETIDATLNDGPTRRIEFLGQEWLHKFEVAALVLDGRQQGAYLGSVEWGWKSDATGTATLDPDPIRRVQAGAPSASFMDAAKKWNKASFIDTKTKKSYDTVDLPITTAVSGPKTADEQSTPDLLARLKQLDIELARLAAGSDKQSLGLERSALERDLRKRVIRVDVMVVSTEDWTGADEVYVKLSGGNGKSYTTNIRDLNDGQRGSFRIPVTALLPWSDSIRVEVFDEDVPDADDLIVTMSWSAPFGVLANKRSLDGADYRVTVQFET